MGKNVQVPTFKLNDSTSNPALGSAVGMAAESLSSVILKDFEIGYRHIDTSEQCDTEVDIRNALQEAIATGLGKREDVNLTSKIGPQSLHIEEATCRWNTWTCN